MVEPRQRSPGQAPPRQKFPIPDDWDGEDWFCIKLDWPASTKYIALLAGLLSQTMRGRWWDESTGDVKSAQSVGREIFARNIIFRPCEDPEQPPGDDGGANDTSGAFGGVMGLLELWEMYMIGVIIDIRCQDGWLQVRRSPCCEWENVCNLGAVQQEVEDVPPWDETDVFSACGKAAAVVDAMYIIANGVWDNKDGLDYVLSIGTIDNLLPSYDLNNYGILGLLNGARNLDDVYTQAGFLNATDRQRYQCLIAPLLAADGEPLTETEYGYLLSMVAQVYPSDSQSWWRGLVETVGYNNMRNIALAGATNTAADCTCPQTGDPASGGPDYLDWYHWADLTAGLPAWLSLAGESEHVAGRGVVDYPSGTGLMKPGVTTGAVSWDALTDIEYIWVQWKPVAGVPYEGNEVRIYPSGGSQFYAGHDPDVDPSGGGTLLKTLLLDYSPAAGESVQWDVEMRSGSGDDTSFSAYITAVGIGGTGPDPF